MRHSISILAITASIFSFAQPSTEVFLFDLSSNGLNNAINISYNEGYDNQPSFWPDGKSVLYARTVDGQTEIARYVIDSEKTEIITNTSQGSEYSPIPIPGTSDISSVRLDTTGLQLLYRYNLKGIPEVLVPDLKIGYHAWISDTEIVTFVLGDPSTMQIINTPTGNARIVNENIGRSLHRIPNSTATSYVDKSTDRWLIKSMDLITGKTDEITTVIGGSEDYCWTPDGKLLMGFKSTIYMLNDIEGWLPFSSLAEKFGIEGTISRMAVSPNGRKIAVVVGN